MLNLRTIFTGRFSLALVLVIACSLQLSACGFQLRGVTELSFKNLNIQGKTLSISKELKRSLKSNGIQLKETTEGAELLLELLDESYEKRILSLSGGGLVREFELNYSLKFRTRPATSPTWGMVQSVQSRRDFSYDDKALLGKAEEESMLITDMHSDAAREVMRRLSAVKINAK